MSYHVDARRAQAVQVGDQGTQINYIYNGTWTDGVAPPPLVGKSGKITAPYRGLRAFGEQDAALFFGREGPATRVLELMSGQLAGPALLVVSGVSGAGKSSLLRAGVLPRLRGAGLASVPGAATWPCLIFTPSSKPLEEVAVRVAGMIGVTSGMVWRELAAEPAGFALTARQAVLAGSKGHGPNADLAGDPGQRRLLLMVDQCEQLFTQCEEEERHAFMTALYAAGTVGQGSDQLPAAMVVLAIRADFEARLAEYRPLEYPLLAQAVQDRYLLTSMNERQLRMAITQPAAEAGSSVDDDLVQVLLEEMHTGPPADSPASSTGAGIGSGVLPLLSHALDQAWRDRTGLALTLADYERTGGIQGAVAVSAQGAYDHLSPARQDIARQIFIRLTATTSDGLDTAIRAARADLTAGRDRDHAADVDMVLETFASERLLTLAADTVEISHEALLTAWPLLRDTWLADSHADRIIRTRLQTTAEEWVHASHDRSYLYSGSRLETAKDTAARIGADARFTPLSDTEKEFLHASRRAGRRRAQRRQSLVAALLALVVGLAVVAVLAVRATQSSTRQRDIAISGQLAGDSEALGEANATASQIETLIAYGVSPTNQARYAMAVAAASPEIATLKGGADQVASVAFSPDGTTLATGDEDGSARLWRVGTAQQIRSLPTGAGQTSGDGVYSVAFSPDGKTLVTGSTDGKARLWNVATGRLIRSIKTGSSGNNLVNAVAFSPDGKTLATGDQGDGATRLWNVATGRLAASLPSHTSDIFSVAFSPDGNTLVTADGDGTVRLWNITERRQIHVLHVGGAPGAKQIMAYSPDGTMLATAGSDGTPLWDPGSGKQVGVISTDSSGAMAFSKDSSMLATSGIDGTSIWNAAGVQITKFPTVSGQVNSVAFSPDGKTLATGNEDDTVRLWSLTAGKPFSSPPGAASSVAIGPHSSTLAMGGNGTARLWNIATGRQILSFPVGSDAISSVAFSPDGRALATGGSGTARLWNIANGRQVRSLPVNSDETWSVAFSPDGKTLATAGLSTARLWAAATGRNIRSIQTRWPINSLAFSPEGKTLATANSDGTVRLWNVATGRQIRSFPDSSVFVTSVAFSPDGKTLAAGDFAGNAWLWNVATGHRAAGPFITGAGPVYAIAFSPDGATLATGDGDFTAQLWDISAGQRIGSPITTSSPSVDSVVFSRDGKTLVTAGDQAQVWNVSYLVDALKKLCARVGGSLTRAEWRQYAPSGPDYHNVCAKALQ